MPSKKNNQKLAHSKGLIWLRRRFGERKEIKEYELQAIHNKVNFQCTNILIRKIYIYIRKHVSGKDAETHRTCIVNCCVLLWNLAEMVIQWCFRELKHWEFMQCFVYM
jgi:hypothetical protein